ncbi:MAG: S1C family serine protease [Actinomycetota bacterium]
MAGRVGGLDDISTASRRFCETCGAGLEGGSCPVDPTHDPLVLDAAPAFPGAPEVRSRWGPRLAALAVLLVLVAAGIWVVFPAVQRAERRIAGLESRVDQILEEQERSSDSVEQLGERISDLRRDGQRGDVASIAARIIPSVFTVVAGDAGGSGFVVTSQSGESQVVTNYHVVADAWRRGNPEVQLLQKDGTHPGTIRSVRVSEDLALVATARTFPALELASELPAPGESVVVVGSPLGLDGSVTAGVVSGVREGFLQFSAPISPGNSGGPVVNEEGQVVGIATFKVVIDGAEGLGFAIPILKVCESIIQC